MNHEVGGIFSLLGFAGLLGGCYLVNHSGANSSKEKLGTFLVLISAAAAVVMIFQGFHLWNEGWSIEIDGDVAVKASTRARGRGGLVVLIIKFFPQFLVFGYGWLLIELRSTIAYSMRSMRLIG